MPHKVTHVLDTMEDFSGFPNFVIDLLTNSRALRDF